MIAGVRIVSEFPIAAEAKGRSIVISGDIGIEPDKDTAVFGQKIVHVRWKTITNTRSDREIIAYRCLPNEVSLYAVELGHPSAAKRDIQVQTVLQDLLCNAGIEIIAPQRKGCALEQADLVPHGQRETFEVITRKAR